MKEDIITLREKVAELFNVGKFEDVITSLTDEVLETEKDVELYVLRGKTLNNKEEYDKAITDYNKAIDINPKDAELYIWRGNIRYNKKEYDRAIADYTKAIEINSDSEIAFYNRGLAWFAEKLYDKAIADYSKIINLKTKYADIYYYDRGNAWKAKKEYNKAIADYTKAIGKNPAFENAYYSRGLAKKENNIDPKGSKQDFEKYLKLAIDENDQWAKYAKYYIKELNEKIKDPALWSIRQLVNEIKDKLLVKEECVHYTSLSVFKKLILEENKFRISEGNFMNDPSEGMEFFDFMEDNPNFSGKDSTSAASIFSPKPFIGSFVAKDKNNDLNMWRFYGKEEGVEAKGCAITLRSQEFIIEIENFLSNEKKEARLDNESDIHFYRVVYVVHDESINFYIPLKKRKELNEFKELMTKLKKKVKDYKEKDKTYKAKDKISLEECLNNIAFLFKSDAYKNENEVRLVVKGIEFEKKYNMEVNPPRVYIELVPIKNIVEHVTLGPKVDKVNEWIAALHYCYKEEDRAPKIKISHLPYK